MSKIQIPAGALCAGIALAAAAGMPLQAVAHGDHATTPAASVAPATGANLVVTRDAETGLLRAATEEERAALVAKGVQLRARAQTMLPRVHSSGARGTRVTDDSLSYSVVMRRADGTLAEVCVGSRQEAEALAKAAPAAGTAGWATE